MSQIFPETVAASSNGTPCFSKLLMAFRMSQENIYCIYTNRDCFASFKSSHRLQAGFADVARGSGVTPSSWSGWCRAGRPDEPERLQASPRGCNAERRRSAGLLGDRTCEGGCHSPTRTNNPLSLHAANIM